MELETIYQLFRECHGVTTDSRHCPKGSLFVALKGDRFNGNAFAAKALESGCRYAIVDEKEYVPQNDPRYILTDHALHTLQQLARYHRLRLGTPVIGITGTNGKTTTKELLAAVLAEKYNLLFTEGNLNNHIGVPLTLLRLQPDHELAVIEMGASHPGDIKELADIAEPDYGLITNVGKAHLEGFGSLEGVIRTKGELFDFLRSRGQATVFVDHDSPCLPAMATGLTPLYYGQGKENTVSGRVIGQSPYLSLEWQSAQVSTPRQIHTRLIGEYNFCNVLAAITVGIFFRVEPEKIDHALQAYTPCNNRSQLLRTASNLLIIDAYNANPTSMKASIGNFHRMDAEHKMLILGDMRELGAESAAEHQAIIDYLESCRFTDVILVGSQFAATRHSYPTYPDAPALTAALRQRKPQGKTILIKGSNGIKLGSIIDYL